MTSILNRKLLHERLDVAIDQFKARNLENDLHSYLCSFRFFKPYPKRNTDVDWRNKQKEMDDIAYRRSSLFYCRAKEDVTSLTIEKDQKSFLTKDGEPNIDITPTIEQNHKITIDKDDISTKQTIHFPLESDIINVKHQILKYDEVYTLLILLCLLIDNKRNKKVSLIVDGMLDHNRWLSIANFDQCMKRLYKQKEDKSNLFEPLIEKKKTNTISTSTEDLFISIPIKETNTISTSTEDLPIPIPITKETVSTGVNTIKIQKYYKSRVKQCDEETQCNSFDYNKSLLEELHRKQDSYNELSDELKKLKENFEELKKMSDDKHQSYVFLKNKHNELCKRMKAFKTMIQENALAFRHIGFNINAIFSVQNITFPAQCKKEVSGDSSIT